MSSPGPGQGFTGPDATAYDLVFDGVKSRLKCGEHVEIEGAPIKNPVSGAEAFPGVVLPQGMIFKKGDLGATTRFKLTSGIEYDHSGKYRLSANSITRGRKDAVRDGTR